MESIHTKRQLAALTSIERKIQQGEHIAAGLSLRIQVGVSGEPIYITLSMETGEILESIEKGLVETLKMSRALAKSEIASLENSMAEITAKLRKP